MKIEASDLYFERAAKLRDQIDMIENYHFGSPKMVLNDLEDRDVMAIAVEGEDACVVVFKIRDGKVIGRQHFYLEGVEEKSLPEIEKQFLQQYYLEANYFPQQILLPADLDDEKEVMQDWLTGKAGQKIEIIIPQIGEKKKLIDLCQKNARFLLQDLLLQKMKKQGYVAYNVQALQKNLNLQRPPIRIEAFDISNIQGKDAVASMVCFVNGKSHKSDYRHFKIRSKDSPDDFAMMREVVMRRYKRVLNEKLPLPDLILIDGGKGQLSSAMAVLQELGLNDQPIIGLAKRLEEVFVPGISEPQNIPKSSAGLKLLQQLRDESHRFAITYHRKLRGKRTLRSPLEEVAGIGPKRRQHLLRTFGSLKKVREATIDELIEKGKLPKSVASNLSESLKTVG